MTDRLICRSPIVFIVTMPPDQMDVYINKPYPGPSLRFSNVKNLQQKQRKYTQNWQQSFHSVTMTESGEELKLIGEGPTKTLRNHIV